MLTGDWLILASICDCNHVAITVMEAGTYPPDSIEPDGDLEVTRRGVDWHPLVIEAAQELHQRYPDCRISPMCTSAYGTGADSWPLTEAVTNTMYAAFPRYAEEVR